MTPQAFLCLLWQYKPEEQYILIWTGQDKRSHWFQDAAKAAEFVESDACLGKCVFVGIGASKTDNGPTRRCTSDEIATLCAVWTDLDLSGEAHKGKALPGTVEDALSVLPEDMPPTITVATGNGAHAWWVFKEPLTFETDADRAEAHCILNRWHTLIRLRCRARGWVYDRLSDLARVARVPGTFNMKEPANPKAVTVIGAQPDRFYNLSDFEEYVDDAGIPNEEAQQRAAHAWAERFRDTPLVINDTARIPQELLDVWMDPKNSDEQIASRFRNTWERRRHDLKDPSQSGYDLALADFGVMAGLAEQQMVDLIVHHRSMHGQKQRHRIDYFQRTIAKATERNPDAPTPTTGLAAPQGTPVAPEGREATGDASKPPAAPTPNATTVNAMRAADAQPKEMSEADQKAMLCEKIALQMAIPVAIMRLLRITGKDPSFRMELADAAKIEFTSVSKFRNQEAVRDVLAGQMKWLMPPIKPSRWREIAQDMLRACFDEEGPIEAKWEEAARDMVGRYLEDNGFIEDIAAAQPQYRGKPIVKDGRIAINTTDFHGWINRTTLQVLSVKAIAGQLSAIGAVQKRVAGKGFREQSRWLLPIEHFNPADFGKAEAPQEDSH